MPSKHDDRHFVGVARVVGPEVGIGHGVEVAVAVLVLEALAGQGGAAGRAAQQEAAAAHVAGGPDQVADPLEAEHRVIDEERDHAHAVAGMRGAGGDERRHRAGLGDPFLEDLPVGRLAIVEHRCRNRPARTAGRRANRCRTGGRGPPCRRCGPRRARWARRSGRSSCCASAAPAAARRPSCWRPRGLRCRRRTRRSPPTSAA